MDKEAGTKGGLGETTAGSGPRATLRAHCCAPAFGTCAGDGGLGNLGETTAGSGPSPSSTLRALLNAVECAIEAKDERGGSGSQA